MRRHQDETVQTPDARSALAGCLRSRNAALMNALTDVAKEEPKLTVLADTVVHAGNGERYAVIMTVGEGTCLEYVATAGNGWHAVAVGDRVGWIPDQCSKME